MIALLLVMLALTALLLVLITFIQILYLESLRLRPRDLPAMAYFKEVLEDRIGQKPEAGAFTFSMIKHTLLPFLGVLVFGATAAGHASLWQPFVEALFFSWVLMLIVSYVLPQILYRRTQGHWVLPLLPVLRATVLAIKPVTGLLGFLQSLSDLNREAEPHEENPSTTAEDIDALISAGAEEGLIEEDDRKLIESVVAFGDKTVREVMTPRPRIVAIGADRPLDELRTLVIHEQYSRIPVYKESIDNIIGFVHVRDMFQMDAKDRAAKQVRELVRPMRFVPETKPVNDLLREMQSEASHMSVVVDEYGNTAGLVTMEDMVEEILGEIRDEHEPTHDVHQEDDGSYVVSGSFDLDHLKDLVEFRAQDQPESTTVGGLVTEWLGRVPAVGEAVERDGIRMEVLAGNELRVEQVRISKLQKPVNTTVPNGGNGMGQE